LLRIKLDLCIAHPPILGRILSQYQELIGFELRGAALLHSIVTQLPDVDFLADT